MTGLVVTVDWPKALLIAAAAFLPVGLLFHLGHYLGCVIGDRSGAAVANLIHRRRAAQAMTVANQPTTYHSMIGGGFGSQWEQDQAELGGTRAAATIQNENTGSEVDNFREILSRDPAEQDPK